MFDVSNESRANWAQVAVDAFAKETQIDVDNEDLETVVGDLLTDLMHLCERNNIDFAMKVLGAEINYEEEVAEEKCDSLEEAKKMAGRKSVTALDGSVEQTINGVFMGSTEHHAVLSLGRAAVIVELDNLEMTDAPKVGQEVTVVFKEGCGVVEQKPLSKGAER